MVRNIVLAAVAAASVFGYTTAVFAQAAGGGNSLPDSAQTGTSDASGTKTPGAGMTPAQKGSTMEKGGSMSGSSGSMSKSGGSMEKSGSMSK